MDAVGAAAKVVLIGDIGWSGLYHLGDEAMTEAAIDMLRLRGITDITLIAAEPEVSTEMYDLPAVPRLGYRHKWSRERLERQLEKVSDSLGAHTISAGAPGSVVDAVAACDAVVIAGGGNLNSTHVHHLFERVSLVRIAKHFGRPVFVSSQTLGPELREIDAALAREIIEYATCFGARESTTRDLAMTLGGDGDCVVHTMDDAMMLTPHDTDRAAIRELGLADRYIIGSFSGHSRAMGIPVAEYNLRMARTLERLSDRLDADVLLVPHLGSFDPSVVTHDLISHNRIVDATDSTRIVSLGMMSARQVAALTEGALMSLSTRYHPAVFGPARGIPAVTITASFYSAVRMRGALDNVGLGQFAIPIDAWIHGPFDDVVDNLIERMPEAADHIESVGRLRLQEQSAWWDAIAAAIKGNPWVRPADLAPIPEFSVPSPWAQQLTVQTRLSDALGQAQFQSSLYKQDLGTKELQLERLKEKLSDTRKRLDKSGGNAAARTPLRALVRKVRRAFRR